MKSKLIPLRLNELLDVAVSWINLLPGKACSNIIICDALIGDESDRRAKVWIIAEN
jgi:hypothetical protein